MSFLPSRKIKRNRKYLLLGALLVVVGAAGYLQSVAKSAWNSDDAGQQTEEKICTRPVTKNLVSTKDITWSSRYVPQPWRPEHKGRVNLHVFEDWCGASVTSLRKNPHYPLYSHSRTTVNKLAVSPSWKNYGLRIFGYIHPPISGDFLFAVGSVDNCEFWLSRDENPENLQLLAYVGKTGEEWTAPGEYNKYSSQVSKPVSLQEQKRFYFELIHKHSNRGTDHVEVAWRLNKAGTLFDIIDSDSLSLYTDESSMKMGDVSHIPQTAASHVSRPLEKARAPPHRAEMLREDPRDTSFKTPLLDTSQVQSVLQECPYKSSYTFRIRAIGRYQGLHFVHLSYVYPNDYTRLTHMESSNTCFYRMRPIFFEAYGFSRYMTLDDPETKQQVLRNHGVKDRGGVRAVQSEEEEEVYEEEPDYQEDYRQRRLLSNSLNEKNLSTSRRPDEDMNRNARSRQEIRARDNPVVSEKLQKPNNTEDKRHQFGRDVDPVTRVELEDKTPLAEPRSGGELRLDNRRNNNNTRNVSLSTSNRKTLRRRKDDVINQKQQHVVVRQHGVHRDEHASSPRTDTVRKDGGFVNVGGAKARKEVSNSSAEMWMVYGDSEMESIIQDAGAYDPEVRWNQTFQDTVTDFQATRSDWIDLNCNVSGNLQISQSEANAVVEAFMEKLQLKYPGQFSLQRIIDVVKRVDMTWFIRYLLELELMETSGARVRLVHYVYTYQRNVLGPSRNAPLLLCNPQNFLWNPDATIHIIVPVKNQARWVQKLIMDLEELYQLTGDKNFNVIITDYSSTDMDIEQTLKKARLPKFQYLRLKGNFERSAGLQAGINLIKDQHSIVFLCDLHLHFPLNFFDFVRKHCVEGQVAFAPIVMRLNCGATPEEPDGYWEVNGFGLLGIYKSDLDAVGGMNTREFTNRWGGEDWELLDRIVEAGLDVSRVYLRNFFHYHHSKRGMWNRKILRRT